MHGLPRLPFSRVELSLAGATLEFLAVEFARDVEYPTSFGKYTQESVISGYLHHNLSSSVHSVVFNTGVHDLVIPFSDEAASVRSYTSNIRWLVSLLADALKPGRSKLVWVNTSRVVAKNQPSTWRNLTSNRRISQFNAAADEVMHTIGIPVLDVHGLSAHPEFQALAVDGIHYGSANGAYYRYVALQLLLLICNDRR